MRTKALPPGRHPRTEEPADQVGRAHRQPDAQSTEPCVAKTTIAAQVGDQVGDLGLGAGLQETVAEHGRPARSRRTTRCRDRGCRRTHHAEPDRRGEDVVLSAVVPAGRVQTELGPPPGVDADHDQRDRTIGLKYVLRQVLGRSAPQAAPTTDPTTSGRPCASPALILTAYVTELVAVPQIEDSLFVPSIERRGVAGQRDEQRGQLHQPAAADDRVRPSRPRTTTSRPASTVSSRPVTGQAASGARRVVTGSPRSASRGRRDGGRARRRRATSVRSPVRGRAARRARRRGPGRRRRSSARRCSSASPNFTPGETLAGRRGARRARLPRARRRLGSAASNDGRVLAGRHDVHVERRDRARPDEALARRGVLGDRPRRCG